MTRTQTFHDHVQELRRRIAWLVLTIGVSSVAGYVLRVPIIRILQHPLGAPLFYTSPAGGFNFVLKVSTSIGIMIALPLVVYHLVRFVEPALPQPIKRSIIARVVLFSTMLASLGVAFGFFVMIPMSLHFFATFSSAAVKPWISVDEYLSFVLGLLVTFAALFQIPLVVLFINRIKPIKPSQLLRYQRHIIVSAFVLAVILPFTYDPVSQFIMAVPIVFLYYFSILLVWYSNRRTIYTGKVISEQEIPSAIGWAPQPQLAVPMATPVVPQPVYQAKAAAPGPLQAHLPLARPMTAAPHPAPRPASSITHLTRLQPPPPPRAQNVLRLDQPQPSASNPYNLLDLTHET